MSPRVHGDVVKGPGPVWRTARVGEMDHGPKHRPCKAPDEHPTLFSPRAPTAPPKPVVISTCEPIMPYPLNPTIHLAVPSPRRTEPQPSQAERHQGFRGRRSRRQWGHRSKTGSYGTAREGPRIRKTRVPWWSASLGDDARAVAYPLCDAWTGHQAVEGPVYSRWILPSGLVFFSSVHSQCAK